ncbi:MAG: flagellar biosynthetic protein FliO [Deltaproteobacteria bacterium]|jgi:flagellar protein FliO/FliZ|nr:flagellar biosynthetic protein FliO [Deltaproteobacteria bacterium]
MENDLGAMVRVIASLAIVLGLLFVCMYGLRRWQRRIQGQGRQDIQVLTTQMILPKRYVSLVRVCGKTLILGITDASMTLLGVLEPDGFHEMLMQAQENGQDNEPASSKTVH